MKSLTTRFLLIAAVTALCVWSLLPLDQAIKLGKDLRGGVSLVYAVELPEGAPSQTVLTQVIDSLKRRVNPQGVLDISFQPQGRDRIEIVMPLPGDEVKALQQAYRAQLAEAARLFDISARDLDTALAEGRATSLAPTDGPANAATAGSRREVLERLQAAFDAERSARAEYVQAMQTGADAAAVGAIEEQIARAEIQIEALRTQVLSSAVSGSRLERAVRLSPNGVPTKDAKGRTVRDADGKPVLGQSPRDAEITALKGQAPDLAAALDSLVTAYDAYAAVVTGYDDPADLKRLLRSAGVLEFHIAVSARDPQGVSVADLRRQLAERGPDATESPVAQWYPLNSLDQWYETPAQLEQLVANPEVYLQGRDLVAATHDGRVYLLLYTTDAMSMTHGGEKAWAMKRAFGDRDELGKPCVAFQTDQQGGLQMAKLTGANIGKPMAIVLDSEVYTAPTLQSQISGSGRITGKFSPADITYLIRVLEGGELEAKLSDEPVSSSILGPAVGTDNLHRGLDAVFYSVVATAIIMVIYYLVPGLVAVLCLALNAIMLFGVMAMIDGTFTLPGLAGVALTMGMAVDANVLIFERLREEVVGEGREIREAIQIAYARAFNAIMDGNITNLIVCVVLYQTAATEVKGFALTLAIGVLTTLFTALFVSRWMFDLLTGPLGIRSLPTISTLVPAVGRLLTPNIAWFSVRHVLWTGCLALAGVSIIGVVGLGREMLESEFRGGISMTLLTRAARDGEPADANGRLLIARGDVENRVHALGSAPDAPRGVSELAAATVLVVGDPDAQFRSSGFQVKVANPADLGDDDSVTEVVVDAVAGAFGDVLDVTLPTAFAGSESADGAAHTRPVSSAVLGDATGIPAHTQDVRGFEGGVAVLIENLQPPLTAKQVAGRLDRMRAQPDFSSIAGRESEVIGLAAVGTDGGETTYNSFALLAVDPKALLEKVDATTWDRTVAQREWALARAALGQKLSLDQVSSFSPAVAESLAASAIVAIILSMIGMLLYIWLRFSSIRYSVATVVAVCFNVIICLGALALSVRAAGSGWAQSMLMESFRIDLNVIAGLLTIIGYSLNDTIVILDRIRENRGRLAYADADCINRSINQTFSRTLLTGGTTLATALILYWYGGTGIRPFAFTFIVGLLAGTVSSIVIAAPLCRARPSAAADEAPAHSGIAPLTHDA